MNEKNCKIIDKLKEDNRHYAEFNKTNQQYWKGMTIIGLLSTTEKEHTMNEKNCKIIDKLKEDNRHYAEFNKTNQQYWKGMTIIGLIGAALLILLMRL